MEKAKSAKAEIEAAGIKGSLSTLCLDVTDLSSIEDAVKQVQDKYGSLDVLVNNAAVGNMDPNAKTRFLASMETNVVGPFMVAEAFRPLLLKASKPYSLWISSGLGSMGLASIIPTGFPRGEAYRASKAALNMLALLEWNENKAKGLKTFVVCPGLVESNLRGTSDQARTMGGQAEDPATSGQLIQRIIEGERDLEAGGFVQRNGIWPW